MTNDEKQPPKIQINRTAKHEPFYEQFDEAKSREAPDEAVSEFAKTLILRGIDPGNTNTGQTHDLSDRVEVIERLIPTIESLGEMRRDLRFLAHLILSQIPVATGSSETSSQRATRLLHELDANHGPPD